MEKEEGPADTCVEHRCTPSCRSSARALWRCRGPAASPWHALAPPLVTQIGICGGKARRRASKAHESASPTRAPGLRLACLPDDAYIAVAIRALSLPLCALLLAPSQASPTSAHAPRNTQSARVQNICPCARSRACPGVACQLTEGACRQPPSRRGRCSPSQNR